MYFFLPDDLGIFRVIYIDLPLEVSTKLMSVLEFFINCQFNRKLAGTRAQGPLKQTDTGKSRKVVGKVHLNRVGSEFF